MASSFTRIVRREQPAEIVYEDERTIAFLDVNPKSDGHTLVVPKREVAAFHDLPPDDLAALALAVQRVARAVVRATGSEAYNLAVNNGAAAGQVVFHVHVHIVPRYPGVPRGSVPGRLSDARAREIGAAIRAALAAPGAS